jgi:Histidine kinase
MITVQAQTAPHRLTTELPEPFLAEFAALGGAAREALTQMRGLLDVLRSERAEGAAGLVPQPRLEECLTWSRLPAGRAPLSA